MTNFCRFMQICWHKNGTLLLAATGSGRVALLDVTQGSVVACIDAHQNVCFGSLFVPTVKVDLYLPTDIVSSQTIDLISWSSDSMIK